MALAGTASQQRPLSATMIKPVSRITMIFDGKNEKFDFFEDLLHKRLKMLPELSEALKTTTFMLINEQKHHKR